jgi:hypothetical protein
MNRRRLALVVVSTIVLLACATDREPTGGDAGSASDGSGGSDAATGVDGAVATTCQPGCRVDEYCVKPGACTFAARCVSRTEVTCPDGGLCSTTGCAGDLDVDAGVLTCICR